MQKKKILLGVCGSVSAYKAYNFSRQLVKSGYEVEVLLTRAALNFVRPETFQAILGSKVLSDEEWYADTKESHVDDAYEAQAMVIFGATAATLSRMASGHSDNRLGATYLSVRGPVLIAPAMESRMWKHPSTQRNVTQLRDDGCLFVGPISGDLASGRKGVGRLARDETILKVIRTTLKARQSLPKSHGLKSLPERHALVTLGATREYLDPARFLSNPSSGKMGFAIINALLRKGWYVTALCAHTTAEALVPEEHDAQLRTLYVQDADTLAALCEQVIVETQFDLAFCVAAVSDFTPVNASTEKIKKKGEGMSLALKRTRDTLSLLGASQRIPNLIGFAAESENYISNARRKCIAKGCTWVALNAIAALENESGDEHESAFESDENRLWLVPPQGQAIDLGRDLKKKLAERLVERVVRKT